jgi:hypothetical protein
MSSSEAVREKLLEDGEGEGVGGSCSSNLAEVVS